MPSSVTLFSARPTFANRWRGALERNGLTLRSHSPSELGEVDIRDSVCIFDASPDSFDEDDLLTATGFARASGATAFVHGVAEDVVDELVAGCVIRTDADMERAALSIARRADVDRCRRFEFVTVAPGGNDVLAILGDGHSQLLKRPINASDDGTDVDTITLSDDATRASLGLASGAALEIHAINVMQAKTGVPGSIPIDGSRLGARLRELRLEAGLTQADVARRTGIHRPNIARVEAGRHTPSLETLSRLASAIGVPTTRVLSED